MMFPKIKNLLCAMAAAILFAVCIATRAHAQVNATVLPATATSQDGLLTVELTSNNLSGAVDVNTTYTWTVTNNSSTITLTGVVLGSHWGDYCINTIGTAATNCPVAPPTGPTLISCSGVRRTVTQRVSHGRCSYGHMVHAQHWRGACTWRQHQRIGYGASRHWRPCVLHCVFISYAPLRNRTRAT